MGDLYQFSADLDKFAKKVGADVLTVTRRSALGLHKRIVQKTPRDTGRAKASWNINPVVPDESVHPEIPENGKLSDGAAEAIAFAKQSRLALLKPYEDVWISNNLVYIVPLEEGHSEQARPAGAIVAISLQETEAEINNLLRALS